MKVTSTLGNVELGDVDPEHGLWAIEVEGEPIVGIDFAYCGTGPDDERDPDSDRPQVPKVIIGTWDLDDGNWHRLHEIPMPDLTDKIEGSQRRERAVRTNQLCFGIAQLLTSRERTPNSGNPTETLDALIAKARAVFDVSTFDASRYPPVSVRAEGGEWIAWIPPRGPYDFEGGNVEYGASLGPFGDTNWPTEQEARAFVARTSRDYGVPGLVD